MNNNPLCPLSRCRSNIVETVDKIPTSIVNHDYLDTYKCIDCGCVFVDLPLKCFSPTFVPPPNFTLWESHINSMIEKNHQDDVGLKYTPIPLFRPFCWIKTVLRSFPWFGEAISGHNYVVTVPFTKAEVEVLRCEDCGHTSIGWVKDERLHV